MGHTSVAELLMRHSNIDVNTDDGEGVSPLGIATCHNPGFGGDAVPETDCVRVRHPGMDGESRHLLFGRLHLRERQEKAGKDHPRRGHHS